jgi:LuxR family maltose regulon positive regulatory protein
LEKTKVDPFVTCWFDEFRINTWLAEGNWDAIQHWKDTCGFELDGPLSYQYDLHHQNLARVLIAGGILLNSRRHQEQALSLLTRLQQAAAQAGWVHEQIKLSILQTRNYHMLHNHDAALLSLGHAVVLAAPSAYLRLFLDEGNLMQSLLVKLDQHLSCNTNNLRHRLGLDTNEADLVTTQKYIFHLISAFSKSKTQSKIFTHLPTPPVQDSSRLIETLTSREMEVLNLLAQGDADKQIAEKLVITRETVHKHLKNIYSKLDVHNRTSAVARARELGLL